MKNCQMTVLFHFCHCMALCFLFFFSEGHNAAMFKIGIVFSSTVLMQYLLWTEISGLQKKKNRDYSCRFSCPSYWRWIQITIFRYYFRKLFENSLWLLTNYVADDIPLYTLGRLAYLLEMPVHLLTAYRMEENKNKEQKVWREETMQTRFTCPHLSFNKFLCMTYYIEDSSFTVIAVNVNQAVKCISVHTHEFYLRECWMLLFQITEEQNCRVGTDIKRSSSPTLLLKQVPYKRLHR